MVIRSFLIVALLFSLLSPAFASEEPSPIEAEYYIGKSVDSLLVEQRVKQRLKKISFKIDGAGGPYANVKLIMSPDENNAKGKDLAEKAVERIVEYLSLKNAKEMLSIKVVVIKQGRGAVGSAVYVPQGGTIAWQPGELW